jgi:glutaconate CoA-transferase subunit A
MDKRISWTEAFSQLPTQNYSIGFGGITLYRRPVAFAVHLAQYLTVRGENPGLELFCFTAGVESDLLVGAGVVDSVRTCYFGLEVFGLAPHFTTAANAGKIRIIEESEASFAYGIRARLADVGFMPSPAWQGTDLLKLRPDVKSITDPYTGEILTAFPALQCDIAVIHALEADLRGNAKIGQNQGIDRELSLIADTVFITTEKIVPKINHADIFSQRVHGVIEAPRGAWPTSCHPLYALDGEAILSFSESTSTEAFQELLAAWMKRHDSFQESSG